MSEDNDLPPHVKLRNKISKEIEALTSDKSHQVLGVATKDDNLVVFFMPNETDIVRAHQRHVRPSRSSNKISKAQATRMVTFLYNQVVTDKGLMEVEEGKIAISQGLLASNPYGITANDISMRGLSAQELCGREAKTIGNLSGAMEQMARLLDIEITAELIANTLHQNCPKTTRPGVIWPAAPAGNRAFSQYTT